MKTGTVVIAAALVVAVAALTGCGGTSKEGLTPRERQDLAKYQIARLETRWHHAETHKNLAEMMSLWAPDAIWVMDPSHTLTGKRAIREFWYEHVWPVARKQNWFSDTPTFKIRINVAGDKGSIYFECHEVNAKTRKLAAVVGQQADVAKIGGRWLITKSVGSSPTL